ncbi:MAG: saccharopine dehydrogenase NADP-binding domain-containing protein [Leptospiraceae bacterium]|nr:saccharopine dehydrogenase NADP-binding domain-containing protein [Leptospiraceae bacterium]
MGKNTKYDIVVFGATGFTGDLTAKYLAKRMNEEPFRLGIAGRDENKLNSLKKELVEINSECSKVGIIPADIKDYDSLLKMALDTNVVITTVGPYLKYGDPVVKACIEGGADYLDLTGEGGFVNRVTDIYNKKAKENKVKVLNCCGFDSIPADLGTYYTVKQLPSNEPIEVECFVSFSSSNPSPFGQFNSVSGGTWHSAIGFMNLSELDRQNKSYSQIAATATNSRLVQPIPTQFRLREESKTYGAPLPFVDIEVVLRSAADLEVYGPNFSYGHYAGIKSTPALLGGVLGMGIVFSLAQFEPTRNLLLNFRKPGEGPDKEQRESNSFKLSFIGKSKTKTVQTEVTGGDPGYGDTSKMLGESALCLIHDRKELPEKYGVITPAITMGDKLIPRLEKAGIRFRTV